MPDNSQGLHEPLETLRSETVDMHRAVVSVMEELEAIDWYSQRVDATQDSELRAILQHNRDDEKEHAAMLLEWIRRHDAAFEQQLRTFLFREGPIVQGLRTGNGGGSPASRTSIGSLREVKT
jgi:uncharacterized protein